MEEGSRGQLKQVRRNLERLLFFSEDEKDRFQDIAASVDNFTKIANHSVKEFLDRKKSEKESFELVFSGLESLSDVDRVYAEQFRLTFLYMDDLFFRQEQMINAINTLIKVIDKEL